MQNSKYIVAAVVVAGWAVGFAPVSTLAENADFGLTRIQSLEKELAAVKRENELLFKIKKEYEERASHTKSKSTTVSNVNRDPRAAYAADMPARTYSKAPMMADYGYNWTGWYGGANAGGSWGNDRIRTNSSDYFATNPGAGAEFDSRTAVSVKPNGFIAGAQLGYNWRVDRFVFGLEGDLNWLGNKGTRSLSYPGAVFLNPRDLTTNSTTNTWLATVRGRTGVTFDRTLLYATGGIAFGSLQTTDTFCGFGCFNFSNTSAIDAATTRVGWTAGVGGEYGVTNNWSVKAEYLYVALGSHSTTMPICASCVPANGITVDHRYTDHIARLGINYRFGGPIVAVY